MQIVMQLCHCIILTDYRQHGVCFKKSTLQAPTWYEPRDLEEWVISCQLLVAVCPSADLLFMPDTFAFQIVAW